MSYSIDLVDRSGRRLWRIVFDPKGGTVGGRGAIVSAAGVADLGEAWAEVSTTARDLELAAGVYDVATVPDLNDWLHVRACGYALAKRAGAGVKAQIKGPSLDQLGIDVVQPPQGAVN